MVTARGLGDDEGVLLIGLSALGRVRVAGHIEEALATGGPILGAADHAVGQRILLDRGEELTRTLEGPQAPGPPGVAVAVGGLGERAAAAAAALLGGGFGWATTSRVSKAARGSLGRTAGTIEHGFAVIVMVLNENASLAWELNLLNRKGSATAEKRRL